jgi:hypothetical protein
VNSHSKDFTERSIQDPAFEGMIKSAKTLAMLGDDLLRDKSFRDRVDFEYDKEVRQKI